MYSSTTWALIRAGLSRTPVDTREAHQSIVEMIDRVLGEEQSHGLQSSLDVGDQGQTEERQVIGRDGR